MNSSFVYATTSACNPTHMQCQPQYEDIHPSRLFTNINPCEFDISPPSSASSSGSGSMPLTPAAFDNNSRLAEWAHDDALQNYNYATMAHASTYQYAERMQWDETSAYPQECTQYYDSAYAMQTTETPAVDCGNFSSSDEYANTAESLEQCQYVCDYNTHSPTYCAPSPEPSSPPPQLHLHQPRPVRPIPIISLSDLSSSSTANFSMSKHAQYEQQQPKTLSPLLLYQPISPAVLLQYQSVEPVEFDSDNNAEESTMASPGEEFSPYPAYKEELVAAPSICPCGCDGVLYPVYSPSF